MRRFTGLLIGLVMVVTLTGCQQVVVAPRETERVAVRSPGPPSHAPAHGYRRKHGTGADLRFDANLGVYVVDGQVELYFYDGWFIRIRNGVWEVSASMGGKWETRSANWVPPGLRAKYHAKNSKARDRSPANANW